MHTIFRGIGAYSPCRFLVICATWCVLEHIFSELSLKKIYINLNNINMLLLLCCALAIVTGCSLNNILNFKLVRLGVYMVKLCHKKMWILRSILPPPKKNWTSSRKKLNLPPLGNLEHPDKKLNSLGIILIPWKNLKVSH